MVAVIYYALMLLLGLIGYRYGQKLLAKGFRDENDEITKPPLGPFAFVFCGVLGCFFLFTVLRAFARGEIECIGKHCGGQIYTLAAHASKFWDNVFFLVWCVLALAYAMYVSWKIWVPT
jgi:hypothetical protein